MGLLTSSATVVCAALNFRASVDALADSFTRDPYKQAPRAPVLYFKPKNTWIADGDPIQCPGGVDQLRMGGTLGVVIGRLACRVTEKDALDHVEGYCVVNDISIPHGSFYRPAIKERCRDDSFDSQWIVMPKRVVADPNQLGIRIFVNTRRVADNTTANLVRPVQRLIADVTEFLTLNPGDMLVVGEPDNAPLASVGDKVTIEIDRVGAIENKIRGSR